MRLAENLKNHFYNAYFENYEFLTVFETFLQCKPMFEVMAIVEILRYRELLIPDSRTLSNPVYTQYLMFAT